jgi:hypothetical protein
MRIPKGAAFWNPEAFPNGEFCKLLMVILVWVHTIV